MSHLQIQIKKKRKLFATLRARDVWYQTKKNKKLVEKPAKKAIAEKNKQKKVGTLICPSVFCY